MNYKNTIIGLRRRMFAGLNQDALDRFLLRRGIYDQDKAFQDAMRVSFTR